MTPEAALLPELLQAKLQPLRELCERYGVEKLELFGSAARGEFDPGHSDLDFIVQMKGRREPGYARRFCDFADALEALYGRPVDLLTELMIKNPYFKAEVGLFVADMQEAITKIALYADAMTFVDFRGDSRTVDAVLHNLLVIGEAARCLPASIKESHPEIDWIAINGLRNRIAHEYFGLSLSVIWEIV